MTPPRKRRTMLRLVKPRRAAAPAPLAVYNGAPDPTISSKLQSVRAVGLEEVDVATKGLAYIATAGGIVVAVHPRHSVHAIAGALRRLAIDLTANRIPGPGRMLKDSRHAERNGH